MIRRLAAGVVLAGLLALPGTAGAQPSALPPASQQSTCTADIRVCFSEYASTPGPHGVIRANTDDSTPTFGQSAFRRAILIFHLVRDPDTGIWVPYLVAQAPWCIAISNCYVEWHTDDPLAMQLTIWWGATFDNNNHVLVARVGYPSA
jgi:hypothetical protein